MQMISCVWLFSQAALAAPWIAPNWAGREPNFPPGSLFWQTHEFPVSPLLYRLVLPVEERTLAWAGCRVQAEGFVYVFLNGREVAHGPERAETALFSLDVELTPHLKPGPNTLLVSTSEQGLALEGRVVYQDGAGSRFGSDPAAWKVQKFPPLTMLEYEPCMQAEFDDSDWFTVQQPNREPLLVSDPELHQACQALAEKRLQQRDEEARWRLQMLLQKGIAIVDWEAHGWAGPARLPEWVLAAAQQALSRGEGKTLGWHHQVAEALTRYVFWSDEATNLENHVVGLQALQAPDGDIAACQQAASLLRTVLQRMEQAIRWEQYELARQAAEEGAAAVAQALQGRPLNGLCGVLDNKFGWFDTTRLLDNDPADWGLRLGTLATVLASPLSPAALVTLSEKELILEGWDALEPQRIYHQPPITGPVCLWVVLNGQVVSLRPDAEGIVYDRARQGDLSENWGLLVPDLSRGGDLPVQMVFLQAPTRVAFQIGEKGPRTVSVAFERPGAQLFLLRPLKEWRGLLGQAQAMTRDPLNEEEVQPYLRQCRLWSRALLHYPVTFSEAFVRDPDDRWALRVADVYNYWDLRDGWNTPPLRLAPLPPLAAYGLLKNYPGLQVLSEAEVLGSWGLWGDHLAAVGRNAILYRVPLDPIKRFGGFTSYCFGPTDIGEPGSLKEIETIRRTGANSFRPQHNQTGERALRTARWCWEGGLQNVFNADEKWILDIVEHYRTLAEQCRDFPPDAIAYDLLNEPETRPPRAYSALIRRITAAIRSVDQAHLIYVEAMPPWGPGAQPFPQGAFETLEPTGDPRTVYSFHDYEYRLPPRWPNEKADLRDLLERWIPAFRFSIDHRCAIHLGEFGGFEQTPENVYENPCALTLMLDYLKVFDQFGWHFHYYSNRGIVRVRKDGSLQESYVQEAYRRYFARGTFNLHRGSGD